MAQQILGTAIKVLAKAAMKKKAKSIAKKPVVKVKPAAPKKPVTRSKVTPAPGVRNPTQKAWDYEESMDPVYDRFGYPQYPTAKINSQKNLSKAKKSSAEKRALKAANRPRRRRGK